MKNFIVLLIDERIVPFGKSSDKEVYLIDCNEGQDVFISAKREDREPKKEEIFSFREARKVVEKAKIRYKALGGCKVKIYIQTI